MLKGEELVKELCTSKFPVLDIVAYLQDAYKHKYGKLPTEFILSYRVFECLADDLRKAVEVVAANSPERLEKLLDQIEVDPASKLPKFRGVKLMPYQAIFVKGIDHEKLIGKSLVMWFTPEGEIDGI